MDGKKNKGKHATDGKRKKQMQSATWLRKCNRLTRKERPGDEYGKICISSEGGKMQSMTCAERNTKKYQVTSAKMYNR